MWRVLKLTQIYFNNIIFSLLTCFCFWYRLLSGKRKGQCVLDVWETKWTLMCLALKHSHLSNYCVPTNILHHHALQYGCTWLSAWGWGRQGDRHQVYSTPHHLIAYYLSLLLSAMHGQLSVTHISGAGHQDAKAMCDNPLFHWHPAQRGITCPWAVLSFTHSRAFVLCASSFCISQRSEEAACNAWRRGHRLLKWMKTSLCECSGEINHEAK